jgi:hypothetical protein
MVEVLRIETSKRLCLELLKGERVSCRESPVEHPLDTTSTAAIVVTPLRLELRRGVLRFRPGHDAVMVRIEHLEQHVCTLLRLGARLVPSSANTLCRKGRRDEGCAERDRDEQFLHASQSFRSRLLEAGRCSCAAAQLKLPR